MEFLSNTNRVVLSGRLNSDVRYSHSVRTENFYTFEISVARESGKEDVLPVVFSERVCTPDFKKGDWVSLSGSYRSRSSQEDSNGRKKHILEIFATYISESAPDRNFNKIELNGYICKNPNYRRTPLGRDICDMMIAVNRGNGKVDYIPIITWGKNAIFSSELETGSLVEVSGRVQSRTYSKPLVDKSGEEHYETRVAYEVSCSWIGQIE